MNTAVVVVFISLFISVIENCIFTIINSYVGNKVNFTLQSHGEACKTLYIKFQFFEYTSVTCLLTLFGVFIFWFFITFQVRTRDHPKAFVFKYAPRALIRWFTVYIYTSSSCFPLSQLISIARIWCSMATFDVPS